MANEIAVVNEQDKALIMNVLGSQLVGDIQFNELDNAIEKLAAHTEALSDGERESAVELVNAFEKRVVSRLENKSFKLSEFRGNIDFEERASYDGIKLDIQTGDEVYTQLFEREGMEDLAATYQAIKDEIDMVEEYAAEHEVEEPFIDELNMTQLAINQKQMEYRSKKNRLDSALHKKQFVVRKKWYEFAKLAKKNAALKDFKKVLKQQSDAAKSARDIVEEKAAAAKMNIVIGNADVRDALRDFHAFAATI